MPELKQFSQCYGNSILSTKLLDYRIGLDTTTQLYRNLNTSLNSTIFVTNRFLILDMKHSTLTRRNIYTSLNSTIFVTNRFLILDMKHSTLTRRNIYTSLNSTIFVTNRFLILNMKHSTLTRRNIRSSGSRCCSRSCEDH